MPGEIFLCTTAIMAYGLRAALVALMPELKCLVCRGNLVANIETFARVVSAQRPQLTIFDADSVNVQEVLEALGKRALVDAQGLGKIVVLTTRPDEEELFVLAKYGARAYLSACLPGSELAQQVWDLLGNDQLYLLDSRTFADPDLALLAGQRLQVERVTQAWQAVPEETAPKNDEEPPLLTDLELRLLRSLSCGMDTHVAARHAGVSYFKAKTTIPVLEYKLQVGNRTGAVIRAWQQGLIDLPESDMIVRYANMSYRQTASLDEQTSGRKLHQVVSTS